jgi:hypothetical protein
MRRYELTGHANYHINYFPTGDTFYEASNRVAMLRAALEDEGISENVEVLFMPEIYARFGFGGIIDEVRRRNPKTRIHGLHGSDAGGAIVRMIYDFKRIWPSVAIRRDKISATAIRQGCPGMTHPTVDKIRILLDASTSEESPGRIIHIGDWNYTLTDGELVEINIKDLPTVSENHV